MTVSDTPAACLVCHRRTPAIGYTCADCRIRVRSHLTAILDLTALAAASITPTVRGGHASGKPASRPPVNLAALDDATGHDALLVLESWERAVRAEHDLVAYGLATEHQPATLTRTIGFLLAWLDRLADSWPPFDVFAGEVADIHRRLRRWDPEHTPARTRVPCPTPTDEGECGHHLPIDPTDLAAPVECHRCGEQWTTDRLMLVAYSDPGLRVWLDPEAAAYATGVSSATLRRWAAAGIIVRDHGRYDLASIREAMTRRGIGA